jgi:hypothetical protein
LLSHHEFSACKIDSRLSQKCGDLNREYVLAITPRNVRTASSEQVRQPISREGIDQWRNYERWLGSLRAALAMR